MSQRNGPTTLVEPNWASSPAAKSLAQKGHKWDTKPSEIGAANAVFFGLNGAVTAISEP